MSCENDSNHDKANYCAECSTCHDCLADALDADRKAIKLLQTENAELKVEIEQKSKTLDEVASHNLKQGMLLESNGIKPESIAQNAINKIKADAIREAAKMPRWGGQPDDIPADFDGYCEAIHEMHEYAKNLEGKQ